STRDPHRRFNGTSLGSPRAGPFRKTRRLSSGTTRGSAEPASNVGGVCAQCNVARGGGTDCATAVEFVAAIIHRGMHSSLRHCRVLQQPFADNSRGFWDLARGSYFFGEGFAGRNLYSG